MPPLWKMVPEELRSSVRMYAGFVRRSALASVNGSPPVVAADEAFRKRERSEGNLGGTA